MNGLSGVSMRRAGLVACLPLWLATVGLTGCLSTTRVVKRVQLASPDSYKTATAEELEKGLVERNAAIRTLNLQVLVTATTSGSIEGQEKEYTSLKGYIFVEQPEQLRVILQAPFLGSRAMDMVSDGKTFTLVHATVGHGDVWIQGSNEVTTPSKNGLENLRPDVFLTSLLVTPVKTEEYVSLTSSTRELAPETKHKDAVLEPTYDLAIAREKQKGGHVLLRERMLHINRQTLLPFGQDIYNAAGQIETQVTYQNYQMYEGQAFPQLINIKRPGDEYSLKIEVTKLTLNQKFEADQFQLPVPVGVTVKKME
jgi:outer membrane lipoprotein-sorting protein